MLDATVKNTFIHFDDRHHVDHRRCSSAPPNNNPAEAQPCPRAAQHRVVGCHFPLSHQEGPQIAEEEFNKHLASDHTNKRKQRPTKKKRNQYHKLLKAISDEMEMNPDGFDIESLQHRVPISMRDNEWLLRKLMRRMEIIHQRLTAQQAKTQLTTEIQGAPETDDVQVSRTDSMKQLEGGKLQDDVCEVAAEYNKTMPSWEDPVLLRQGGVANKDDPLLLEQAEVRVRNTFIEIWVPEELPLLRTQTTPPVLLPFASSLAETESPYGQKQSAVTTQSSPAAKADAEPAPWVLKSELSERRDSFSAPGHS